MSIAATEYNRNILIKRKMKRTPVIGRVFFYDPDVSVDHPYLDGLTSNISEHGACVLIEHRLHEGCRLDIQNEKIWDTRMKAEVMWCRQADESVFAIGLSFI